jgi:surfeit locus 1 family protein
MRSDLLRPRAILSHLLVLTVAATCVGLGLWQLDRLSTLREHNARAVERMAEPPAELSALVGPAADGELDLAGLEFRRVTATGTYRLDEEVLQRGQQHQNLAGFHVLTPLELDQGGVVLVRRGWVPSDRSEPPVADAAPPPGPVTVTGVLELPVDQPGWGPRDPDEGVLARVFHTDTARLDRQVEGTLFPMVLRIDAEPSSIGVGELPVPAGSPELDERNHLSYAVQWFSFALLALATYGAWLWTRQRRRGSAAVGEHGAGPGGVHGDGEPFERVDVGGGPQG